MTEQNLLTKNLNILLKLNEGKATLDELAKHLRLPRGFLPTPLRVLQDKGLVEEDGSYYVLSSTSENTRLLIEIAKQWLNYTDNTYLEIAKDVAKIILTNSWGEVGVQDVLLFGSTLRGNCIPDDIDLLILHDGSRLKEFYPDPYGERPEADFESDKHVGEENNRVWAYGMLSLLGYRGDDALMETLEMQNRWNERYELERKFQDDSVYNKVVARIAGIIGTDAEKIHDSEHVAEVLDNLFDIHAMSTTLFASSLSDEELMWQLANASECDEVYTDITTNDSKKIIIAVRERSDRKRTDAIKSCRDPTFWHTVLSEGRLYSIHEHDFTIKVDDKYPGATALFEQR